MIDTFLKGLIVDVSRSQLLNHPNAIHCFVEPDNFYRLDNVGEHESIDTIYSKNLINETKFFKVLIKEWFYYTKVGGHIIIEFEQNEILSLKILMEFLRTMQDKIEIKMQFTSSETNITTLVLKKIKPALHKNDSINKWTFGILTNGTRTEWLEKEIDSIIALKIPNYEIIISGNYDNKKKYKNLKIIPINDEHGWITRKKNDIAKMAKYENLVITHDRYVFDKDWFEGMKKYGNYFELICCKITDAEGKRVDDWITFGTKINSPISDTGLMDYRDWDDNGYVDGGLYIMKKDVWRKVKWDERLMWGQGEDLKLGEDFQKAGIVQRMNIHSSCKTLAVRGKWPYYEFDKKRLGRLVGRSLPGKIYPMIRKASRKYLKFDIILKRIS